MNVQCQIAFTAALLPMPSSVLNWITTEQGMTDVWRGFFNVSLLHSPSVKNINSHIPLSEM